MLDYIKKLITPDIVSFWLPSGQSRAMDLIRGNHGQCYGTHPNVPVVSTPGGANLITDGGLNIWTSATDLTHWVEVVSGTSTINREATEKVEGDYSCRFDVDASNSDIHITQSSVPLTPSKRCKLIVWYKNSVAGKTVRIRLMDQEGNVYLGSDGAWHAGSSYFSLESSTVLKKFELEFYVHADYSSYQIRLRKASAASSSIYLDDLSIQEFKPAVINPSLGWHFDGVDDYIELKNTYVFTSNHSIGMWINSGDLSSGSRNSLFGRSAVYGYVRLENTKETTHIEGESDTNADSFSLSHASVVFTEGTWYFVVITQDGSKNWKLYVDGQYMDTDTTTDANLTVPYIGQGYVADPFAGHIALPFIANAAWSLQQVENFYNATKGLFSPRG